MKRGDILDAVKNTITQDRNDRHGEPENSFPRIAEVWSGYINRINAKCPVAVNLKPSDVAEMLAMFKTVRFETQPDNPDNEHDRIGYYAIAAELRAKERADRGSAHGNLRVDASINIQNPTRFSINEISRRYMMPPGRSESDYDWKTDKSPKAAEPYRRVFTDAKDFPVNPEFIGEEIELRNPFCVNVIIYRWVNRKWVYVGQRVIK